MLNINKPAVLVIVLFLVQFSVGQNNTNSPYTRYGYGELVDVNSGEQRSMGGAAFGMRSSSSINPANPASYSVVDSTTFMFDVGLTGLFSRFSDPGRTKSGFNSNLEYVTLQFPITKWLGFSAGMLPYSFSGYDFFDVDSIKTPNHTSTPTYGYYTRDYSGRGGISQVYSGVGLKLFNHISLGVNAYYMFGEVTNSRAINFSNAGYSSTKSVQDNAISVSSFRFRYGMQLFHTFKEKHDVTLGLVYEDRAPLNGKFVQYNRAIPADTVTYDDDFGLPVTYGIGLNYTFDKKLTFSADYMMQRWTDALFFGKTDSLNNRAKIAVGVEYIPNLRGNKYVERMRYRAGLNLHDPYYKLAGSSPAKNFGITFGVGLPLRTSNTMVNASIEYGKVGEKSLFREDYFKITFNATFNENWFFKRKL
ncbi:MAG: hypothetical protein PHQ11_08365 [Paludibacter sp.]|nr:hypothetical protein [Paludibacter sp.]MDD4426817.1 hypothetical protein [Paludibacter sp.]